MTSPAACFWPALHRQFAMTLSTTPVRPPSVVLIILVLSYITGVLGMQVPVLANWLRLLTPIHLAATLAVLLWYHMDWRPAFRFYAVLAILTGYLVEVLGVHTGFVFGEYAYGPGLGFQVWQVPPVIGLNWLTLSYCCGSVCDRLPLPVYLKTIAAATLMVSLDFFIEPVAIHLRFWSWTSTTVPIQNYLAWWLVSLALLAIWYGLPFQKKNPLAGLILALQFFFFIAHNLFNYL